MNTYNYDLGGGIRYDSEEYREQIQNIEWNPEWNNDNIELQAINADGGPGSGRYPKGSGKKNRKSLKITPKEREKVCHEINNLWHARYKDQDNCVIVTRSNKKDSPFYSYKFRNVDFGIYDIYHKSRNTD